jgi:hypothetical protein
MWLVCTFLQTEPIATPLNPCGYIPSQSQHNMIITKLPNSTAKGGCSSKAPSHSLTHPLLEIYLTNLYIWMNLGLNFYCTFR